MIQVQQDGRFTTLGGRVPVLSDDIVVGGLGVSGGSVEQDIEIADGSVLEFARV